jgi:hypothetical protein
MRSLMIFSPHHSHSSDKIENKMGGKCSTYGEISGTYRISVEKTEGMRPLGRPRRRWEDNIKMDLQEVVCGAWTALIWHRTGTGGGHF